VFESPDVLNIGKANPFHQTHASMIFECNLESLQNEAHKYLPENFKAIRALGW
jgi:hypothetical protein